MQVLVTLGQFLIFAILALAVFGGPGFAVISRRGNFLSKQETVALSLTLGLVMFVLLASLLGVLHLRFATLPILLIFDIFLVIKFKAGLLAPWVVFIKEKLLLLIILTGVLVQGMINFPSGFLYPGGLYFWSSQGHDGLWHVALMEEIKKNFPPQNPIFAGEGLYNYHYLIDVAMGEFARIFPFFSSLDLYFRFFPVLLSVMIGMAVYSFVSRWQENKQIGYWAMFFTYFVGSFGFVVNYLKGNGIFGGETTFWAAQGNTILGNPPHAASYSLVPTFFLAFLLFTRTRERFWLGISFLLAAVLAGFKVSGGLVIIAGLAAASLADLILNKKLATALLAGVLGVSNFLTFKVMTRGAESFLIFLPWWFVRTMVVAGNRLNWIDLENKRQHYLAQGTWHANLRVVQVEATAFFIFLFGNLGMRLVGFYELFRRLVKDRKIWRDPLEVALPVSMLTGFVMPMLFVQRGIIYNNIQFMQYFLLIFGFYAAITVYKLLARLRARPALKFLVVFLLVALSVPTVIGNLVEFYGPGTAPLAKVNPAQLEALSYLRRFSGTEDVVLNMPFNKYLQNKFSRPPRPIYAWYSTAFIPALAGRPTYLSSEEQALITGYPTEERLLKMKQFFEGKDFSFNRQFLQENHIRYVYLSKDEVEQPFDYMGNGLKKVFENREVVIYST